MARNPKNPGTVRRGKKGTDAPQTPSTPSTPATPAAPGAPAVTPNSVFDALASTYKELEQITGSPPDITRSIEKMLQDGMDPQEIVAGMSSRGVDVSPFMQGVAPPARAAEVPPNNLPAPEAAPVEAVNDLPEPDAPTPVPAAPVGGEQKNMFQRVYEALAEAGYSEDQIFEMSTEDSLSMAIRERPDKFPEFAAQQASTAPAQTTPDANTVATEADDSAYELSPERMREIHAAGADEQMLVDYGFTDDDIRNMSDEQYRLTVEDVKRQLGLTGEQPAAQPDAQQVADSLRTPIMDAIERASDPNAMPTPAADGVPMSIQDQIRMYSGMSRPEDAYKFLSNAGIPDSVLARMDDEQMVRMAAQARSQPTGSPTSGLTADATQPAAPSPQQGILRSLRDQQVAAAEAAVGDALFPPRLRQAAAEAAAGDALFPPQYRQGPPVEAAATTQPTAGLVDAGPLEMPTAANPYGSDIYTQLQMATFGPGMPVQTRFSPDVPPAPAPTGRLEMPPGFESAADDPNVRLATQTVDAAPVPPQVMDVGANIQGGVAAAGAPVQWRNSDGTLNAGGGGGGGGGPRGPRGERIIRALLGTPAQGDQPARLGLISPELTNLFSGADGGMAGKASRFLTNPRTLLTAATLKYLMNSKGGLVGQGGIAGEGGALREAGKQVMYGSGEPGDQQDNDNVDYATNYRAALDRLSRPMSGRGQTLSLPMVPNNDRPSR